MQELITGLAIVMLYFIVLATAAIVMRKLIRIPDEIFRKMLHFILQGSFLVWTLVFRTWYWAIASALGFAAVLYPVLQWAERWKAYSKFVTERKSGELKRSLIVVFVMYAVVASVCWGWLNDKLLLLCSIYAWGIGDAAAALVGKRFGKHGLEGKYIEGRKSMEGTLAMFAASFLSVFILLLLRGGMSWYAYPVIAAATALVSALVELFTKGGMDTITCPLAAMAVLLPMVHLMGGGI